MTESDSAEAAMEESCDAAIEESWNAAMAESWNLMSKARDFLMSKTSNEVADVIGPLFMRQETSQYQASLALYDCCVANFADFLTLKLLKVYRNSPDGIFRFRTIHLLSEAVAEFRNRKFRFSLSGLRNVKPLLISCLEMQETKQSDIKILRRIVSFVAYNVVVLDDGGWDELNDCILSLANSQPLNAFYVFLDLPADYGELIDQDGVAQSVLDKAKLLLFHPEKDRVQDWILALETHFKIGVQLSDLITIVRDNVVRSARMVEKKGMKEFLERGLEDLSKFLARDGNLCRYSKDQRDFVEELAFQVAACYQTEEDSHEVASDILRVVKKPNKYNKHDQGSGFERDWCDYLANFSSLEILRIFQTADLGETSRELAIRRLNLLLSNHTSKKVEIDIRLMRQLQPLLISCLQEDGLSDSMFKVLGEVVFHVANEMLSYQEDTWFHLWDYIGSQCKTQFQRAVYIFQCLTMEIEDGDFLIPVIDKLLPEIGTRLNPPGELLVDNSCWVLAFVGAFCVANHLIEVSSHAESVKEITYKMVDSVRELVERGMEVGLVMRAFRDLGSTLKKQLKWYCTSNYKFVKGLLWRLSEIKGMKMESKMVLWRINMTVERGVHDALKKIPKSELDWLIKPEA